MIHKALVLSSKAVSGDDASDHGLVIGSIVTVVGFVGEASAAMAVVIHNDYYYTVPIWMLRPEPAMAEVSA